MKNTPDQTQKQIFTLLKYTFVVVPIVAGADKFTNVLTDWQQYLSPEMVELLPLSRQAFMMIVGIIEIVAGIVVFKNSYIGGYIVAVWLASIALALFVNFHYVDVAVRDMVMSISAFSMARLSKTIK
ncbi:hypothetical protein HP439_02170 [Sphingobacterium shayense]|uniref:hypothetical protein n=1 Tax=Sphingobacterium shayense TaxID=626343 RepID=UPI00155827EC|nr:hypothetical protein [Sphingobacterium shayense]NQD69526.1 hypothetical protein [Sphingobacterium shayense]